MQNYLNDTEPLISHQKNLRSGSERLFRSSLSVNVVIPPLAVDGLQEVTTASARYMLESSYYYVLTGDAKVKNEYLLTKFCEKPAVYMT